LSTAQQVPETWHLTGDDARKTLLDTGRRRLAADAFKRLRVADGFSHARSLAFTLALVLVQAIIALVGLASVLGEGGASDVIVRSLHAAAPGPAGDLLTDAVEQAHRAGASHQYLGLVFGLVGAVITGTTMMGQFERALNRLYGVEQDRPTVQKYARAFLLTCSAGVLLIAAFGSMAFGREIGRGLEDNAFADVWAIIRWPLALTLSMAAMATLFKLSPRRRQPGWSWLAFGATVSVILWSLVTLLLGLFFRASTSFGATYGPLAGVVALLLWAFLSSVAVLFGASVAAQLEAVRAGRPRPQDTEKVEHSEPESDRTPVAAGPR
jgi:YihY family inner membrane protein